MYRLLTFTVSLLGIYHQSVTVHQDFANRGISLKLMDICCFGYLVLIAYFLPYVLVFKKAKNNLYHTL